MNRREHAGAEGPETDYSPDEAQLLLTELQLRDLGELRIMGMDVARDVTSSSRPDKPADLAFARISKIVLQIAVLEQQTIGLRDRQRAQMMTIRKVRAKKEAVSHAVSAAAAARPAGDLKQRDTLMRGIIQSYDFSDPRKVAAIVADICEMLGVPFEAEIWPDGAAPEDGVAPEAGDAPAEAVRDGAAEAAGPAASAASAEVWPGGVAAFARAAPAGLPANGHDPP